MSFNPDPSKQAQVIFSRKMKKPSHPLLIYNNNQVIQTPSQKQLGLLLDEKLNVGEHLRYVDDKVNTPIGLLNFLRRQTLFTIYKSFIRPHFDNEDVIFDQAYNSFMKTMSLFSEMLQ